jgi:hypothetical protein
MWLILVVLCVYIYVCVCLDLTLVLDLSRKNRSLHSSGAPRVNLTTQSISPSTSNRPNMAVAVPPSNSASNTATVTKMSSIPPRSSSHLGDTTIKKNIGADGFGSSYSSSGTEGSSSMNSRRGSFAGNGKFDALLDNIGRLFQEKTEFYGHIELTRSGVVAGVVRIVVKVLINITYDD